MLQEFDSKKVIKVRNGIFRKNEIQQNNISSEINPSLNCEFPIWISTMIAQVKEIHDENEFLRPRKNKNRSLQKIMDYSMH